MIFGSPELLCAINFLVAIIGLFSISEILLTMEDRLALPRIADPVGRSLVGVEWS
ncbi:hypothetical protein GA0061098_1009162 [Bradyrhizobium shewense]|uniref:CNNM transmembrane domain-containing protein n=1 Tax=Bradyrhizobium shewense TaxID=1761772 RepID=A0A1C3WSH9_9BRAD|nr:hypothetical protein GA0061098_1009162 [Bradyrhizobium shewense]